MTESVLQGRDLVLELELLHDEDGSPIKPSTLSDYHIYCYRDRMRRELELTFKKTPGSGEHGIKVENDDNGLISIIIPRSWTKSAEAKSYYLEFIQKVTAGAEFQNNEFVTGDDLKELMEIKVIESSKPEAMA